MQPATPSAAVSIISMMITPALLILATASLLSIVLDRLARVVENVRQLGGSSLPGVTRKALLALLSRRAELAEAAVTCYFLAVGLFVATCLFIAVDHALSGSVYWLPVSTAVLGVLLVLAGTSSMLIECRLAVRIVKEEISQAEGRLEDSV